MKNFIFGFFACFFFFMIGVIVKDTFAAKENQSVLYPDQNTIVSAMDGLFSNYQAIEHTIIRGSTPTATAMRNGEIILTKNGNVSLICNVDGATYSVILNK